MSWLSAIRDRLRSHTTDTPTVQGIPYRGQPLLDYGRLPEDGWQVMLDDATATGDGLSSLWLQWVPGDPWQPVHRWFVFQLQPWGNVPEEIRKELTGPHPRTNAQLEYRLRDVNGTVEPRPHIVGGPCGLIDRVQWVTHRAVLEATGRKTFPRYWWVIQGDHGGHPFSINMREQVLRREQGLEPDVPSAGDLPYAPFDRRVLAAMERYDLFRYAHGTGDLLTKASAAHVARLTEAEIAANKMIWSRWTDVAEEVGDQLAFAARQDGLHYHRWSPVGERPAAVDDDAMADAFIHSLS